MNVDELFPSKFLKAADIKPQGQVQLIIAGITREDIGEGESKNLLYFQDERRRLVLNQTNASMIAMLLGKETDYWTNQQITLGVEPVAFQGKIVDAIRVKAPAPQPVAMPPAQGSPAAPGSGPVAPIQPQQAQGSPMPTAAPSQAATKPPVQPGYMPPVAPQADQPMTTPNDLDSDIPF